MTSKQNLSGAETTFLGGTSGVFTRLTCQPFDVVKIRYQLQSNVSSSLILSIIHIYKQEGLFAFWKGHTSAQYLSFFYGVGQFSGFDLLSRLTQLENSHSAHFVVGAFSGVFGSILSFPFDVIRTRMISQTTKEYSSIVNAASCMFKADGIRVFYRGAVPTLLSSAPYSGCQFGFYYLFTAAWTQITQEKESIASYTICGLVSGLVSKTLVYPFDTLKKRMQVSGFLNFKYPVSMMELSLFIYKNDGIIGFYRGLRPALIKAGVVTAVNFTVYNYLKRFLLELKYSSE